MQLQMHRAYLLQHFQDFRIVQPQVVFVHGLPASLAHSQILQQQFGQLGFTLRISLQHLGKDFYSAFVEFQCPYSAALLILILNDLPLGNRTLRVFYGSTKFCPHFLKDHPCHLSTCNYAHYYFPQLTHLKHQAKDIDHNAIASLLLSQHQPLAVLQLQNLKYRGYEGTLFLHLARQTIETLYYQLGGGVEVRQIEDKKEGEWNMLEKEIESQTTSEADKEETEKEEDASPRVQQFLDAAERFLTRLIFQSSVFVY